MAAFSLAGRGIKFDRKADLDQHIQPLIDSDVSSIDLSGNTFGVEASEALAPILADKKGLLTADLHDIFTSRSLAEIPPALTHLLTALLKCPNLHTIDLSDNAFGLNTKGPLVDFLSKHVPLKHLILNNNGMGPIAGTSIAEALCQLATRKTEARKAGKDVPDLESVVCGRNRLENGSMNAWAKAYQAHDQMKSVKMTQNGIRPEGITTLVRSGLAYCTSLEVLDMQDNTFTIKGATALADNVGKWKSITELGVGDDLLGGRGAIKLFEALEQGANQKLEILRLQYNDINPAGVKALLRAAQHGLPALRRVELNGNKFDEDDASCEGLAELLSERKNEHGEDGDAEDHWGLDELDELEGEDDDEEDEEDEEDDDDAADEEQGADEDELAREKAVADADKAEDEPVAQDKDKAVDDLANLLDKTKV